MQALIFDVDGTIADTEEVHRQAFNAAFLEMELWWNWGASEYMELLKISGGPARIEHYVAGLGVAAAEKRRLLGLVPGIHRVKTRIYHELISGGRAAARPGVMRLIREAREAGLKLALASTSSTSNIEALVSSSFGGKLLGDFDAIASADEVSHKKPAPDLYLRIAAQLRVAPADCLVIEDSENGVRAAKAAGMTVVATPSRWTATQDFSAADQVLYSLGDPGAPLDAVTAKSLGATEVGVGQLRALHAARTAHAA
ncbi:MAG: HAD-IA family hydrolase [Betaproteobacteria bacterium]|nr:HAD-IA family hydrolase [Betaproteobacteria bacterium]